MSTARSAGNQVTTKDLKLTEIKKMSFSQNECCCLVFSIRRFRIAHSALVKPSTFSCIIITSAPRRDGFACYEKDVCSRSVLLAALSGKGVYPFTTPEKVAVFEC